VGDFIARRGICVVAPLLVLAAARCGGNASNGQASLGGTSSMGGGSLTESGGASAAGAVSSAAGAVAGGSANALGSAGQIEIPIDAGNFAPGPSDCNSLSDATPAVILQVVANVAPTPEGGTIANGLYHLTQLQDFTGLGGASTEPAYRVEYALAVSASTSVGADLQTHWLVPSGELPIPVEQSATIAIRGTSYTYSTTCTTEPGSAEPGSMSFTASGDTLVRMYPIAGGVTRVETFTRQ
jgi:hypothetical protein